MDPDSASHQSLGLARVLPPHRPSYTRYGRLNERYGDGTSSDHGLTKSSLSGPVVFEDILTRIEARLQAPLVA